MEFVYTPPPTGSGSHTIKLPCGSSVTIMTADQLGVPRLDVTLTMASGYQAPGGLCNKLPSQSTKQLVVPTLPAPIPAYHLPAPVPAPVSAPASALHLHLLPASALLMHLLLHLHLPALLASALHHCINPSPSHFCFCTTQVRATSAAVAVSASKSTSASTTVSVSAASSILAASTASPSPAAQGIAPPPPPPPQVLSEIERSCKTLFDIPGCTNIVPADFFIQSCILDAKLSGSLDSLAWTVSMDLTKARQFDPVTRVYKANVNIQMIVQYQTTVAAQPLIAAPRSTDPPRPAPRPASAPRFTSAPAPAPRFTSAPAPASTSAPAFGI
ncbi:hypothetical protein BASA81_016042 [Batrachochytrium salamandrivorans]|nr:hypothetical protein BASA81_016042 [Batrachochytrium salamandrivorans]